MHTSPFETCKPIAQVAALGATGLGVAFSVDGLNLTKTSNIAGCRCLDACCCARFRGRLCRYMFVYSSQTGLEFFKVGSPMKATTEAASNRPQRAEAWDRTGIEGGVAGSS